MIYLSIPRFFVEGAVDDQQIVDIKERAHSVVAERSCYDQHDACSNLGDLVHLRGKSHGRTLPLDSKGGAGAAGFEPNSTLTPCSIQRRTFLEAKF